jgi:hypothetical protein
MRPIIHSVVTEPQATGIGTLKRAKMGLFSKKMEVALYSFLSAIPSVLRNMKRTYAN